MMLYNKIDEYAARLRASWVNVHHASKGDQSEKAIIDVGSGAGAQSRAADCHLIIRPHQEDELAVVDAAVRSWKPVKSFCIRWNFPLWEHDPCGDPTKLRSRKNGSIGDPRERIIKAAAQFPSGETMSIIRDTSGLKAKDFQLPFTKLVAEGELLAVEIFKTNRKAPYEGYVISSNGSYQDRSF